jgi:hypothetical protein
LTVVVQAGVAAADAVASGTATPQPSAATLAAMSAHRMNLRMMIATLSEDRGRPGRQPSARRRGRPWLLMP